MVEWYWLIVAFIAGFAAFPASFFLAGHEVMRRLYPKPFGDLKP